MKCNKYDSLSSKDPQHKFESIVSIVKIDFTVFAYTCVLFACLSVCLSVCLSLCVLCVYVCVRHN